MHGAPQQIRILQLIEGPDFTRFQRSLHGAFDADSFLQSGLKLAQKCIP